MPCASGEAVMLLPTPQNFPLLGKFPWGKAQVVLLIVNNYDAFLSITKFLERQYIIGPISCPSILHSDK